MKKNPVIAILGSGSVVGYMGGRRQLRQWPRVWSNVQPPVANNNFRGDYGGKVRYLKIVLCLVVFCCASQAYAAEWKAGIARKAEGAVFVDRQGKLSPLKEGDTLNEQDTVVTQAGSVGIVMKDDSLMSVGSNSRLTISKFVFEPAEREYSLGTHLKQGTMVYLTGR